MNSGTCRDKLSRYIQRELDLWDFSGVIRVVQNGQLLFETCRGEANRAFGVKNAPDTRFALGSVTKQFTAFAVMLLSDRGLVDVDRPARAYLPGEWGVPDGITVHHLLCHTSGLYNAYNLADDFYVGADRLPYDRERFVRDWILRPPMTPPGQEFNYNNANYNLLAWLIEHLSGQSYPDFLGENLFAPLGMADTAFDDGMTLLPRRAENVMHDRGRTVRVPYTNPLFHLGAGSLVSTCDDLQRWYQCLRDQRLLSPAGYARFFAENRAHYCYGLNRGSGAGEYYHGGDMNGLAALSRYRFHKDQCILILSNNDSLNQYRLGDAIADILDGKEPLPSQRPPEIPVSEETLRRLQGVYLPGKLCLEAENGQLYLVRPNQGIHIALYCVAPGAFLRRDEEQSVPYRLFLGAEDTPVLFGYKKRQS